MAGAGVGQNSQGRGLPIILMRQDPQRYKDEIWAVDRSSYASKERSCRVEYETATFFEVNTYLKYPSVENLSKILGDFFSFKFCYGAKFRIFFKDYIWTHSIEFMHICNEMGLLVNR